jgi:threonine synthase
MGEGRTPLRAVVRYGTSIGLSNVIVKLDFLNPTGSFKDRGCAVNVSKLRELKVTAAMDDSSGNAGASLAGYCAAAGIDCTLYVPAGAPKEKLLQAELYGASVVKVPGTRTDVAKAAEERWKTSGLYYASHNLSPFFFEGMKTLAYEICEDLNWRTPDHVVFPVGGGALMAGAWKGFKELLEINWISQLPKLHCVQSDACAPIVEAYRKGGREVTPVKEMETVAGGIRISNPRRGAQVLESIRESHGEAVSVNDAMILRHQVRLARSEGVFAEPTSCAALAGLEKLHEMGVIQTSDRVIVPLTGFGLKDTETASKMLSLRTT